MFGRKKNWDFDEKTEVVSFLDTFTTRHQNVENFAKIASYFTVFREYENGIK